VATASWIAALQLLGRILLARRHAEHRAEERLDLGCALADERLEPVPQRLTQVAVRIGVAPQPVAQDRAEGPVGKGLAVGDAPTRQPPSGAARSFEAAAQLGGEPGLADASIAGHDQHTTRPVHHRVHRLGRRGKLLVAPDQR